MEMVIVGFFVIFAWIHGLVIQFKTPWKKRSGKEIFVTLFCLTSFTYLLILSLIPQYIELFEQSFRAEALGYMTAKSFYVYLWIHYAILQFKRSWKERSKYEKFVTIAALLTMLAELGNWLSKTVSY